MSLFLGYSQEESFQKVMDYFQQRQCKILTSTPPSLIKAEFGSYLMAGWSNAKCEIKATVTKGENGSNVNFGFDFRKRILFWSGTALAALLLFLIRTSMFSGIDYVSEIPFIVAIVIAVFVISVPIMRYNINLTKRKFIEEFGRFSKLSQYPS
jgi:hypothetical protein